MSVSPGTDYTLPGGTSQFLASETITDCSGVNYLFDITGSSTWSSSDTAVATVESSGLVTGLSGGVATMTATFSDDFTSGPACLCSTQPRTRSGSVTCNVARLRCGTTAGQQGGVTRGSTVTCQIKGTIYKVTLNSLPVTPDLKQRIGETKKFVEQLTKSVASGKPKS